MNLLHPKGIPRITGRNDTSSSPPISSGGIVLGMQREGNRERLYYI